MAKGYWIGRVDVHDADAYKNDVAKNGIAFAKYGGRFLVRGGAFETVSGAARARKGGAEVDLIVVEGYDGPQPGEG